METKLKSVLQNPQLRLAFKSLIFGALLLFTHPLIFLAGAVFLYAKPLFRTFELIEPFAVLLVTSLLLAWTTAGTSYLFPAVVYSASLFYLVLGVKDLAFIQRTAWHRFLNLALAYGAFILFFYHSQEFFLAKLVTVFFVTLFLFRDIFRKRLVYWLLSFLMLEAAWGISLLPIGFINSANLAVLVYFVLTDLTLAYSNSTLTRRRILTDVTIFVLLTLAIFAFSRWSL